MNNLVNFLKKILSRFFFWRKLKDADIQLTFANCYKHCKVKEKTVFYQSYRNKIMGGNPYAIFKELINSPDFADYTHIWAYGEDISLDDDTFQRYKDYPNVVYVKSGTREYYQALASSQYLINNAALPSYWSKKEDQIYINTWHGTPLKTLGRQAKDRSKGAINNAQRNFFLCDYMVMPNRYTIDRMLEAYDLQHMLPGKIIDAGYPRVDLVQNTDQEHIIRLLEKKMNKSLKGKKLILYAPTFRSEEGKSVNTSQELGHYMSELLRILPDEYELVFKVHNMMAAFFRNDPRMKSRMIFDEIETNELLSVTDILITDYSSIFFEFLCRKKPILFFVYDRKEYEGDRGLYRPLEEMPGALCETVEELEENILAISAGTYSYEKNFNHYLEEFAYHDDGQASRRVVDIAFRGRTDMEEYIYQEEEKNNILVITGEINTPQDYQKCEALLRKIDAGENSVTLLSPNGFSFDEEVTKIDSRIKVNASNPILLSGLVEKVLFKLFHWVPNMSEYRRRQYRKYFGDLKIHKVYDIASQETVWRRILKDQVENYQVVGAKDPLLKGPKKTDNKMTILFIGAFDSTNYVFVNLIKELEKKGHKSMVVVPDPQDQVNNKMFITNHIPLIGSKDFPYDDLAKVDLVLSAPMKLAANKRLFNEIEKRRIFTISFTNLFSSVVMRVYTDLIFAVGTSKFQEFEENGLHYSMVATGNPQYDELILHNHNRVQKKSKEIKRVLFIDQGGYPFGKEGKEALGQTILAMAKHHPDLEFVVKPRFLPQEEGKLLHQPSEHLYDFIKNPPANLKLLRKPTILEDIMPEFDAMVTMWSTAYLDAAFLGIPLMLIRGLPTEDVFDVRRQRVEEAYDRLEETGCVVDYHQVLDGYLEFKQVDPDYLKEEVGDITTPVSPKIVALLEKIYKELVVPQRRLNDVVQMDYDTFSQSLPSLKKIPAWGSQYGQRRSFFNYFNYKVQDLVFENRCMAKPFHLGSLHPYWYYNPVQKKTALGAFLQKVKVYTDIEKIRRAYYHSPRMARETDPIRLDHYFEYLYKSGKHGKIVNYRNPALLPETESYFRFVLALDKHKYQEAAQAFADYYHSMEASEVKPVKRDRVLSCGRIPRNMEVYGPLFEELIKIKEYALIRELCQVQRFNLHFRTYMKMRVLLEEDCKDDWKIDLQAVYDAWFRETGYLKKPDEKAGKDKQLSYGYYLKCQEIAEKYSLN